MIRRTYEVLTMLHSLVSALDLCPHSNPIRQVLLLATPHLADKRLLPRKSGNLPKVTQLESVRDCNLTDIIPAVLFPLLCIQAKSREWSD